jgi:hypothetical protein
VYGNCLTYAVGMLLAEGFTGRIKPSLVRPGVPKVRFFYVNARGERTYFYPWRPKRGWRACVHALWFHGAVRKG